MNKLIQGDCLEVMKTLEAGSVDMILTDPPYGMSFRSNYRKKKYRGIKSDTTLDWLDIFASECFRVAKNNTAHYVFCSFHNIDKFKRAFENQFKVKNILIWEKNNTSMGDLAGDFAPKYEMILFLHKGRRTINGKRDANILKFSKTGNNYHPTQKPVDMCEYLLAKFSDVGNTVLDPFMGSGTVGVACKNLNRDFIGIELDKTYFEIAKKRIAETPKPLLT